MSPSSTASPQGTHQRTRSCATELVCHRCEHRYPLTDTVFACPDCGKGLDIVYDYDLAARHFAEVPAADRPISSATSRIRRSICVSM